MTHSARNLGIIFDEHLAFSNQISSLFKSCYSHIHALRFICSYLNKNLFWPVLCPKPYLGSYNAHQDPHSWWGKAASLSARTSPPSRPFKPRASAGPCWSRCTVPPHFWIGRPRDPTHRRPVGNDIIGYCVKFRNKAQSLAWHIHVV